jgi:hypothetical protein
MAIDDNIDLSEFDKEYELIQQDLKDLDDLYSDVKVKLQESSGVRSNPVFVVQQTGNLINIKEKKLNIYKEMVNIKKLKTDIQFKKINLTKDDKQGENTEKLAEIFNMLLNVNREDLISSTENNELISDINEDDIDKYIEANINASKESEKKKKENADYENLMIYLNKNGYMLVFDESYNKYIVDSEFNMIEKHHMNLDCINVIETITNDEGEVLVKDSHDKLYEMVTIEED